VCVHACIHRGGLHTPVVTAWRSMIEILFGRDFGQMTMVLVPVGVLGFFSFPLCPAML